MTCPKIFKKCKFRDFTQYAFEVVHWTYETTKIATNISSGVEWRPKVCSEKFVLPFEFRQLLGSLMPHPVRIPYSEADAGTLPMFRKLPSAFTNETESMVFCRGTF